MSLLNFFPTQRRHWQQQPAVSADYRAGGLAALAVAETAFRATPLLNARQQAEATQQELEEVSYQLSQARQKIKQLEAKLREAEAAPPSQLTASQEKNARKRLRWVLHLARSPHLEPDGKVEAIRELSAKYLEAVRLNSKAPKAPATPDAPVPLPE